MFRPRVIPVLGMISDGLVKTTRFSAPRYLGDPINAVKIFNELEADELVLLDIRASRNGTSIQANLVEQIGCEAFMPFAVGGGISSERQAVECIRAGAEKVVLESHATLNPELISRCADKLGSQSVILSVSVKRNIFGKPTVRSFSGKRRIDWPLVDWLYEVQSRGAGEIIINDIDNDGTMNGYDLDLVSTASAAVKVPLIALGGAGSLIDMKAAVDMGAHATAASSCFVYQGPRRGILINYPTQSELMDTFCEER